MLSIIASFLIAIWLIGFFIKLGGVFIHLILIVAVAMIIYDIIMRSRKLPS